MDVRGYTKTFDMNQGTILGNDQESQALLTRR